MSVKLTLDKTLSSAGPVRKVTQVSAIHGQTLLLRQTPRRLRIQIRGPKRNRDSETSNSLRQQQTHLSEEMYLFRE